MMDIWRKSVLEGGMMGHMYFFCHGRLQQGIFSTYLFSTKYTGRNKKRPWNIELYVQFLAVAKFTQVEY